MLEQDQRVRNLVGLAGGDEIALEVPGSLIVDPSETEQTARAGARGRGSGVGPPTPNPYPPTPVLSG